MSLLILTLALAACGQGVSTPPDSNSEGTGQRPLEIYTVNYPLAWGAKQLLGGAGQVRFPVPADIDPAFWQPDLNEVVAFQQADMILLNGANYARWMSRVSLPDNRLVDSSRDFADRLIAVDTGPVHSHGPAGDHSHGGMAFTVWLDLDLYQRQLQTIATTVKSKLPQQANSIAARESELIDKITEMDKALMALGREFNGAPILYSHPVYQYFGRRYQFNGRAMHWEPDQLPQQSDWSELHALLEHHRAAVMLWEDDPMPETRAALKALGVEVVVFRPMGKRPKEGDFLSGMTANIDRLKAYLHVRGA
ncbi:MAG: metal ABC transporter substrate-binding protein [Halioglobus sp.]